jgi:hypothetical protein
MKGIYFKDGVYILVDNDTKNDMCIYHFNYKSDIFLNGERIRIRYRSFTEADLFVNGIHIINIIGARIEYKLGLSEIVSHLNAIQTNGVDAFLENYKKNIDFLYGELKELEQKKESMLTVEQEDSKIKELLLDLNKIRELLFLVLAILFNLKTHMPSGLENEKVISICQAVMDSLT